MRVTDIFSLARLKTKTNTTSFPNTEMLLYTKAKLPVYQADIEEVNENYNGSIEYRDLVATDEGTYVSDETTYLTREYNLPSDMIPRLGKIYAKLDGTNWVLLRSYNLQEAGIQEEDNTTAKFTNKEGTSFGSAGYCIFRGSIFLLTGEIEDDVTGGLKIWTYSFTSVVTEVPDVGGDGDIEFELYGIPETMQELFAVALGLEWKSNQERPIPLTSMEQNYYALYSKQLDSLKGLDRSREIKFERPADGYDNGFNL